MARSVREIKAELTKRGIDFSYCREKSELEILLDEALSSSKSEDPTTSDDQSCSTTVTAYNGIEDGCFAAEQDGTRRRGWVEFVEEGEALCHWDDGSSGFVTVNTLEPLPDAEMSRPPAFEGSFDDARSAAFANGRLLVCAITGARGTAAEKAERLQALALTSEEVSALVGENAVFWRGGSQELREPHVQQLAPQGAPALAMVLPIARDAMKVLSTSTSTLTKEAVVNAFIEALEGLETHKAAAEARMMNEEAMLRMDQEDEFAAALAADQERAVIEESARESQSAIDASVAAANTAATESAFAAKEAAEHQAKRRRRIADDFLANIAVPEDVKTARLSLRLPTGARIERTFAAEEPLERVRLWAECCELLPEAKEQSFGIPSNFGLAIAFPRKRLGAEDLGRSLLELGLVPNAALLLLDEDA